MHGEYVKKASDLDAKFCGTSAAERPGPVESRLAAFGTVRPMVVGHYGELSPFFEEPIDAAADSLVLKSTGVACGVTRPR